MVTGELNNEHSQEDLKCLDLSKDIPSARVPGSLRSSFVPLVVRVLTRSLRAFKDLKVVVIHHIPHQHSKEMAEQSQEVN